MIKKPPFKGKTAQEIEHSIINKKLIIPDNQFSFELNDLVRKLLEKTESERIGLSNIKNHPWYWRMARQCAEDELDGSGKKVKRAKKIKVLREMGFTIEAIKDTLEQKKLNHLHTCFQLIE